MKKAFSLIELVFVIVILGILAGVAIPRLSATRDDAEYVVALENLRILEDDITSFYISQGRENLPIVEAWQLKSGGWTGPVDISKLSNVSLVNLDNAWFDFYVGGKPCIKIGMNALDMTKKVIAGQLTDAQFAREMAIYKYQKYSNNTKPACQRLFQTELFKRFDVDGPVKAVNYKFLDSSGKESTGSGLWFRGGLIIGASRGLFDDEDEIWTSEEDIRNYASNLGVNIEDVY